MISNSSLSGIIKNKLPKRKNFTKQNVLIAGIEQSPYVNAYSWSDASGWGKRYPRPASIPSQPGEGVAFSPTGKTVILGQFDTPNLNAYPWDDTTGFGTKFANPAAVAAAASGIYGVHFNSNGTNVALTAADDTAFLSSLIVYPWDDVSGFGTKFADPVTKYTFANDCHFRFDDSAIVIGFNSTPYIAVYPWDNSTGFGTKYSDPASLPPGSVFGAKFSPNGTVIAMAHSVANYIGAYPWSAGFGTKYSDPASLPTAVANSVTWHPSGNAVVFGVADATGVYGYPWSSGFGTKYSDPATLPATTVTSVAFNSSGASLAVGSSQTPFIQVYKWSNGFGAKYDDPVVLPRGQANSVAFKR